MAIGVTFIIVAILVVGIWIIIEAKRMKHKIFAIFLIFLILFTYISFTVVLKNHDVDFKSPKGFATAGKLYFSWLAGVFGNLKSVTQYAIKQDWNSINDTNVTSIDNKKNSNKSLDNLSIWDKL